MSLKKIIRKNIEDSAVTEPKIANEAVTAEKLGTDFITGLDELTSVAEDDNLMIYDTSAGVLKKVSKSNTTTLTSPTFSSVSPDNSQTVDGGNITFTITGSGFTAGTNARLIGASGQRLNFTSVTRTSTTSITATIARSSLLVAQSPYGIQVINGEGLAVTTASLITIDNIPIFNTAAGSLGTFTEGDSIDIEVSAYDPDSTSGITYELQSGSLPAGLSLVNESGDSCRIQGTASAVDADTTSNFTLRATDSASNTTSRAFSITIEDFALNGLRFDDGSSDYLNRTPSGAGNRRTWTWSCWFKRSTLGTNQRFFSFGESDGDPQTLLKFNTSDQLKLEIYNSSTLGELITNRVFRDVSAWYHLVVAMDTTNGTAGNRMRIYINGSEETSFSTDTNPSLNTDTEANNSILHRIGNISTSEYFDGYMAEVVMIDGSQLTPTSFGETDSNGVWIPKKYSGSFGTNGFHLDFADGADLGNDVSGNDNDFTENNLTSIDKVEDTPQNNYATLNALVPASRLGTISDGNLKIISSGDNFYSPSTIYVSKGKWYAEFKLTDATRGGVIGAISSNANLNTSFWGGTYGTGISAFNNLIYNYNNSGGTTSFTGTISQNDIIGIALDMDNKKIYAYHNGSLLTTSISGNVLNDYDLSTVDDYWTIGFGNDSTYTIESNFGNPISTISSGNSDANGYGNFEYAVPSGYFALNTKNLAEYG